MLFVIIVERDKRRNPSRNPDVPDSDRCFAFDNSSCVFNFANDAASTAAPSPYKANCAFQIPLMLARPRQQLHHDNLISELQGSSSRKTSMLSSINHR